MSNQAPRYAVLYKTHFWDAFADRQFHRLLERVGPGDVFIVVDETQRVVSGIPHGRVIRMSEETARCEGYRCVPPGNVFWYNTDYQLYHFVEKYPDYDYVVTVEYDVCLNIDIELIVRTMSDERLDFVGEPIRTPASLWNWAEQARPFYSDDVTIEGRLVCFAAFSREFAYQLAAARRAHTKSIQDLEAPHLAGGVMPWPNNEAFVGAEINRLGIRAAPLSYFGDTSSYDWAPAHVEFELPNTVGSILVHPVLDGPRFFRSVKRFGWDLHDVWLPATYLGGRMDQCDPSVVVPAFLQQFLATGDTDAIEQLRNYALNRAGARSEEFFNIALRKPATQSSSCTWSRHPTSLAQDASGAVDGHATGAFGFHTNLESAPWWCVDLELECPVREIRVYNRLDRPQRARSMIVNGSLDMRIWRTLYDHHDSAQFGGADGNALRINFAEPVKMRFLLIHLADFEILNLDQVEVFV